jgi:hypothetical protein
MKTNIYVDGFNFYYGAVKGTPYKWLNIAEMCRLLLPNDQINSIKYFTALVHPRPRDPDQRVRQETYIRALKTNPVLQVIYGTFLSHEVSMPLAGQPGKYARVIKTEEKGSDVNLATHLLMDGFRNEYELAVVVSNDSDLLTPIKVVMDELHKPVGVLLPVRQGHPSRVLTAQAAFVKNIRDRVLAKSQFPNMVHDHMGSVSRPASW